MEDDKQEKLFEDESAKVLSAMEDAERKAWEALSGYKFWMFGYHAGRWINYNNLLNKRKGNPFADAVRLARGKLDARETQLANAT